MAEIHRVLENFPPKLSGLRGSTKAKESATPKASFSDIPDIFFDEILQNYRLARQEIQILLYFIVCPLLFYNSIQQKNLLLFLCFLNILFSHLYKECQNEEW